MPTFIEQQQAMVGETLGISDWFELNQDMITSFANLTGDQQFIHVDPDRAKTETDFGGTIAHGFLVLSLAVQMSANCLAPLSGQKMGLNYGFDKVRFIRPVPVNSRVRGRFELMSVAEKNPGQLLRKMALTIEIDDANQQPAIVAEWLSMAIL